MNSISRNIIFIICVLAFLILINRHKSETQQFEGEFNFTIGKTIKYSFLDGFKDCIEYKYFVNKVKYTGCVYFDSEINLPLNKFYKVKYSIMKPEISELYLNEQITDSIEIMKKGFKLNK